MTSASSPHRRPSPLPRRRPQPAADTGEHDISGGSFFDDPTEDEPVRLPGIAAMLRRHRKQVRRGYAASIAAGVALFVVATLTTPLAGADVAGKAPVRPTAPDPVSIDQAPTDLTPAQGATPAQEAALKRAPEHAKHKAPANHRVISGLAANGIPKVALNAYRVAAARMSSVEPSCGIDWALLAGIGREESDHGRFAGAELHADGTSTPPVIGPALDGVHWDYIPAPGNGLALDGDAKYAHALGPMQFIPSTWASYGADATGDGKADVFNINDAALGSARYLCAAGGDLRTHAGQVAGVLTYNHSDQYLAQVLALAGAYRRGVPVSGIPVGITSGKLPTVVDTGYIPPVNPGAPTAVNKDKKAKAKDTKTKAAKNKKARNSPARTKRSASSGSGSKSAKPTSGGGNGGNGGGAGSSSTAPKPGSSAPKPRSSPTPSPSKSCNALQKLLHLNGC